MKKTHKGWLRLITGSVLCLTAAVLGLVDALIPQTERLTLNITLLAGLFTMGLILAVSGVLRVIRSRRDQ